MKKRTACIIGAVILIVGGLGIGYFVSNRENAQLLSSAHQVRADLPGYKYINPLLFSDGPKSIQSNFASLASDVSSYITTHSSENTTSSVSVYFRDLNAGEWTGVNENETYTPSSMLKVLAMMSALKVAESNPAILSEILPYHIASTSLQYFKPNDGLVNGDYRVDDLISAMIKYSDNDALYSLLQDRRINNEFNNLYSIFQLPKDTAAVPVNFMSPREFSVVFRTLYNSTLFEWGLSDQALDLLTHTTFVNGLVAGVPPSIPVAHKFGEKADVDQSGSLSSRELHDCGIIYYPDHPYFLCVMTRGEDYSKLATTIADISRLVYGDVHSWYTGK